MVEISGILNLLSPERKAAVQELKTNLQQHIDQKLFVEILNDLENQTFEKIPQKERPDLELRALTACVEGIGSDLKFHLSSVSPFLLIPTSIIPSTLKVLRRSAIFFAQAKKSPGADENAKKRKELFEKSIGLIKSISTYPKADSFQEELYFGQLGLQNTYLFFKSNSIPCQIPEVRSAIYDGFEEAGDILSLLNAQILVKKGPIFLTRQGFVETKKQQFSFLGKQFPELFPLIPGFDLADWRRKIGHSFDIEDISLLRKIWEPFFPVVYNSEIAKAEAYALYDCHPGTVFAELISGLYHQKGIIEKITSPGEAKKQSLLLPMVEVSLDSLILAIRICKDKNITLDQDFL